MKLFIITLFFFTIFFAISPALPPRPIAQHGSLAVRQVADIDQPFSIPLKSIKSEPSSERRIVALLARNDSRETRSIFDLDYG